MTRLVTTAALLVALISWGQDTTPTPTPNPGTVPYPLTTKGAPKTKGTSTGGRGGVTSSKNQGKSEHTTTSMDVKVQGKSISPTPGLK